MQLPKNEEIKELKNLANKIKRLDLEMKKLITEYDLKHQDIIENCDVSPNLIFDLTDNEWKLKDEQGKLKKFEIKE